MAGFILPPQNHVARELAPVEALVDILDRKNIDKMLCFGEALRYARDNFPVGAKSIALVCLRADDERWLITVGPRGGWKKVWNYGRGY